MERKHVSATMLTCLLGVGCAIIGMSLRWHKAEAFTRQLGEPTTVWDVDVDWTLQLGPDTLLLYEQTANVISTWTNVPDDRLTFYSAVDHPPNSVINGWNGLVQDVQLLEDGSYEVTVGVSPYLSTTDYGSATVISTDYSETFNVLNGTVTYTGFLDPQGLSGQPPMTYEGG